MEKFMNMCVIIKKKTLYQIIIVILFIISVLLKEDYIFIQLKVKMDVALWK